MIDFTTATQGEIVRRRNGRKAVFVAFVPDAPEDECVILLSVNALGDPVYTFHDLDGIEYNGRDSFDVVENDYADEVTQLASLENARIGDEVRLRNSDLGLGEIVYIVSNKTDQCVYIYIQSLNDVRIYDLTGAFVDTSDTHPYDVIELIPQEEITTA